MSRTKTGTVRRAHHKEVLTANKGFHGAYHKLYKRAHEGWLHAGMYAYVGRRLKKRDFRSLWIVRINAALKTISEKLQYSRFIHAMKKTNIALDRKVLAELAVVDFKAFTEVVKQAGLI